MEVCREKEDLACYGVGIACRVLQYGPYEKQRLDCLRLRKTLFTTRFEAWRHLFWSMMANLIAGRRNQYPAAVGGFFRKPGGMDKVLACQKSSRR